MLLAHESEFNINEARNQYEDDQQLLEQISELEDQVFQSEKTIEILINEKRELEHLIFVQKYNLSKISQKEDNEESEKDKNQCRIF